MDAKVLAIMKEIGKNIKKARIDKEITQEKLSELIDVQATYLSRVERGKSHVSLERIIAIKLALGISFAELFEMKDEGKSKIKV